MMKHFLFIGLIFVTCMFIGCNGYLDTRPSNGLEDGEAISSEEDLLAVLRGAYSGLIGKAYYGADFIVYGEVKGDDVQPRSAGQRTESAYRFSWTEVNTPKGLWLVPYEVIRNANYILESVGRGDVADSPIVRDIEGQALALRALCHFDLLLTYGYPYLKDRGKSAGVPLVDKVLDADAMPERSSVAGGYKMVVKDLKAALPLIQTEKKNGYFNKWAVEALLARVCLYQGNWDTAWVYARHVIEESPYTLIPTERYVDSWAEEYAAESILELAVSERSATNKELLGYLASPSGYACMIATQDFKNLIDEEEGDVRRKLLTEKNGHWFICKYPGRLGYISVNNVHLLRLSEVYLIAAEAALKKENPDQEKADLYLNAIRLRANPGTKKVRASEENILKERRKELVLEGHRFFDAMRLGKKITRQGGFHFLNAMDLVSPSWDDPRIVAPLPE